METFLVQVWVPAEASPDADIRGLVRHIATGVETPFRGGEEMLLLLGRGTERRERAERPLDPGTAHPTLQQRG